ncbi:nidogen-like domain-containing protein [Ditylenchus destructor]|nr:nidogen-like domain-containing protein [Ditylenchus destructor]
MPSGALAEFHETVEISATLAPYPIPCGSNNHDNNNQCCDELATNGPSSLTPLEISDLYPFGSENGDLELFGDDSITDSIKVPSHPFNFLGSPITSLFVTTNGYISIDWHNIFGGPPYGGCDGWQKSFVAKIIAPFWADHDLSQTGSSAHVYYRTTTDVSVIEKAKEDIGRAFPKKFCDLDIKWALVATWYNATFYGYNCPTECDGSFDCAPRNTFQAVIATDGIRLFAIFYYQSITWHSDAGDFSCIYYPTCTFVPFQCGDVCTGLGGRWASVGFDNRDGTNYYWHPSMCGPEIVDIDLGTNTGVTGVYIYRIDEPTVIPADPHC